MIQPAGKQENLFFELDGKEQPNEEAIVARLLQDDVLLIVGAGIYFGCHDDKTPAALYVDCGDLWAWACAECEPLPRKQLLPIIKMHLADPQWGALKWACQRRGMQPQKAVRDRLKESGSWDEAMEALSKNPDDMQKPERSLS